MLHTSEIHLRDPFVVPVAEEGRYYLFGTNCDGTWGPRVKGFSYFTSANLSDWEGPFPAFTPAADFWAERDFWAPEVHRYQGRYYLLASFIATGRERGTQILAADKVSGPYQPHSPLPVTPAAWTCLDGTLYVDPDETPWMVFCHEWVQVHDGEICAVRLRPDLTAADGEPVVLFTAAQSAWAQATSVTDGQPNYVTDGPFLYRTSGGTLLMLWSSFIDGRYVQGLARSTSGHLTGPWVHEHEPLYRDDGGHGMLFRTFTGALMLALHQPNRYPDERPLFLPIAECGDNLTVRTK